MKPSPLRFFFVICGPSLAIWLVAAILVAYGGYIAWLAPSALAPVLAIAMFLQAFAASTGYRAKLRAGHFDPLLVSERSRARIAIAHWTISVAPGVFVWVTLGIFEFLAAPWRMPKAFTPAVLLLFAYVSTVVWAISVVGGRWSGALLWLAVLFGLNVTNSLTWFRVSFNAHPKTVADTVSALTSTLVVPMLLTIDPASVSTILLLLVAVATGLAWFAGALAIRSSDAALVQS